MSKSKRAKTAWHKKYRNMSCVKKSSERRTIPENNEEYVKVRVQSTPEEITGFQQFLNKCEELGLCQVMNFSDMFPNRGTNKYYRAYSEVKIDKEGVDNE